MKALKGILIGVVLIPALWSCNHNKVKELEVKNTELTQQLQDRDSSLNSYLATITDIEDNLDAIKEKQNLITANTSDNPEMTVDIREKLLNDLIAINDLMSLNKEKIEKLQQITKNSSFQIKEFKNMVAKLNKKLAEKDQEVESLNSKVKELAFRNQTLADNVTLLNIKVDTLQAINTSQRMKIEDQEKLIAHNMSELSAGFVATGTAKELEEKHIITKEGGILGIGAVTRLNEEVDKDNFLQIDINKTQTIPLMVKKARLITDHPADSYKLEQSKNGDLFSNLVITDPKRFWNTSRFLVVRVN